MYLNIRRASCAASERKLLAEFDPALIFEKAFELTQGITSFYRLSHNSSAITKISAGFNLQTLIDK